MSGGVPAGELRDFASLMVDEVIAKVRIQLDAGESLSVADQRLMLEQLIVERKRLSNADLPDNTYTPYGKRSARNLAELLGIATQEPTVVTVINRAYDEIVFLRAATPTPPIEGRDADVERVLTVLRNLEAACDDLAASRSRETYLSMIDRDYATPRLEALDAARREARAALQALGERG